ncbi:hypothetical protein [Actinopolymorpha pittospori]|uniref:Uncharacterized protein n=1 Tax=Actinopolymorpha pittospori TaxID=648752 RepID=A0A927R8V6_9ACTN|nr:hypothetical protein [Actinopolymorpha pittospori]MBE1603345.1 hypothetical protein [Actinopolymorpha pittospori]
MLGDPRTVRELSSTQLSEQVHYSKGHRPNVERGKNDPPRSLRRGCDQRCMLGAT